MVRSSDRCLLSRRLNPIRIATIVAFGCLSSALYAQLPTTQLTTIFPAGGKIGSTVEVRLGGTDLDDANQLQFSHPGIKAIPKMAPATEFEKAKPVPGAFTVQIAGDVPPGRYDARAIGRFGVSNPRAFVAGAIPEANDPGGNVQPASALAITLDTVV